MADAIFGRWRAPSNWRLAFVRSMHLGNPHVVFLFALQGVACRYYTKYTLYFHFSFVNIIITIDITTKYSQKVAPNACKALCTKNTFHSKDAVYIGVYVARLYSITTVHISKARNR